MIYNMEKRILFISEKKTMIANALIQALEDKAFQVVQVKANVTEISRMEESGKLRPEQARAVYRKGILTFLDSDLGKRMTRAACLGQLHKESQFVMSVPVQMIDPACDGTDEVVVQGIVDAWFTEGDSIVIMDYKTDRVSEEGGEATLKERYARQLDYYARALSAATGLPVAEKWIYSFHLHRQIPVSDP